MIPGSACLRDLSAQASAEFAVLSGMPPRSGCEHVCFSKGPRSAKVVLFGLAIFEIVVAGHERILYRPVHAEDESVISFGHAGPNEEMLFVPKCLHRFPVD